MLQTQFLASISKILNSVLNPKLCIGCEQPLHDQAYFCCVCIRLLERFQHPCTLCGHENNNASAICAACLYDPPRWQKIITPLIYNHFNRDLIIQLKFNEKLYLANNLVNTIVTQFETSNAYPQLLIPVPLHPKRLIERGYNQAFEIASIFSKLLQIPIDTQSLQRIRHTDSQLGLSAIQREKNILKAFRYQSSIKYTHVAVVDDVVTTGSTANEITKVLHKAGVTNVEIWGLARVAL